MSSFYYDSPSNAFEPYLAVECDICAAVLRTDRTGQEFPEHITVDARQAGWGHYKEPSGWIDLCPECVKRRQEIIRQKYFEEIRQ